MKSYGGVARIGVAWAAAREGAIEIIGIPTTIVLARLLSPQEFGIAAAASFFVQLADRLMGLGFNTALMTVKEMRPEHPASVFVVTVGLGAVGWLAVALGAPAIAEFLSAPELVRILPVAALSFVITGLSTVPSTLLARDLRFRARSSAAVAGQLAFAAAAVLLAWRGYGPWSLVIGNLIGLSVTAVATTIYAGWLPTRHFSAAAVREMLSFGMGVYAKRLLDYGAQNLDNLLIARLLGMSALGFYDKAFSTTQRIVGRLTRVAPEVSLPILVQLRADHARLCRAYQKITLSIAMASFPLLALLATAAPSLISVLFGSQWSAAVVPFQWLCVAGALKVTNAIASLTTQARGLIWPEVRRLIIYVVLVVGGVVIGSRWGVSGAAAGVVFATIVMWLLMHFMLRRILGLSWKELLTPLLPAAICAALIAAIARAVAVLIESVIPDPPSVLLLGLQLVSGGITFLTFLWFSSSPELRAILDDSLEHLGVKRRRGSPVDAEVTAPPRSGDSG